MKNILIVIIFIFLIGLPLLAKDVATTWNRVDDSSFINTQTIVGLNDRYGYSFMLKAYNKGQYEHINGQRILYTISQYFIDCERKMYKIGVIDSYAEDGSFVNGDYNKYAKFRPIVLGTAISNVADNLCVPFKNP